MTHGGNVMPEFTVHVIRLFRNKKDPRRYMTSSHTLSGTDISARIGTILSVESKSWDDEWELVAFSHAFLPFEVGYQI